MLQVEIVAESGITLSAWWKDGPRTFLGLMIAGFPNLFMIYGPGSPGIRSHGILMAETQVDWIVELVEEMARRGVKSVMPSRRAEDQWTTHVADVAARGLFAKDDTQYVGANVPGKPRVYTAYLGGVVTYRRICRDVRERGYEGLIFDGLGIHTNWSGPPSASIEVTAI
jgi:cyclohexanone monooxygenase